MKPIVLQNVLDDRLLSIIQQYMKHAIVNQVSSNVIKLDDGQESLRYSVYGEPLAQVILKELTPLCSNAAGKDLYPHTHFLAYTSLVPNYVNIVIDRNVNIQQRCRYTMNRMG